MIAKPAATAETCGRKTPSAAAPIVENSSGQSRLSSVSPGCSSGSDICTRASASSRAIGGEAALRRPIQAPNSAATSHQPIVTSMNVGSKSSRTLSTVSVPRNVAEPALSSTVTFRKSTNRTAAQASRALRSSRTPSVPSTIASASRSSSGGPSSERTPTRTAVPRRPMSTSSPSPRNASMSVMSSPT